MRRAAGRALLGGWLAATVCLGLAVDEALAPYPVLPGSAMPSLLQLAAAPAGPPEADAVRAGPALPFTERPAIAVLEWQGLRVAVEPRGATGIALSVYVDNSDAALDEVALAAWNHGSPGARAQLAGDRGVVALRMRSALPRDDPAAAIELVRAFLDSVEAFVVWRELHHAVAAAPDRAPDRAAE